MKKLIFIFFIVAMAIGGLFAENLYESFGGAFPPAGWSIINGLSAPTWERTSAFGHSNSGCAYTSSYGTSYIFYDDWLITPQLIPKPGASTFSFYSLNNSTLNPVFSLKLSTTTNAKESFATTIAANVTTSHSWTQYTYNLSAWNGQNIYLAFHDLYTYDDWDQIHEPNGDIFTLMTYRDRNWLVSRALNPETSIRSIGRIALPVLGLCKAPKNKAGSMLLNPVLSAIMP